MDVKRFVQANWDRVLGWVLIVAGGVALALGWFGVSGTPQVNEQLAYIASGGLFGIGLIGVGATLLLSADLRDEWRKLMQLDRKVSRLAGEGAPEREISNNGDASDQVAAATSPESTAS